MAPHPLCSFQDVQDVDGDKSHRLSAQGLKQSGDVLAFTVPALGGTDCRALAVKGIADLLGGLLVADFEFCGYR